LNALTMTSSGVYPLTTAITRPEGWVWPQLAWQHLAHPGPPHSVQEKKDNPRCVYVCKGGGSNHTYQSSSWSGATWSSVP